ncbi:MAG: LD-carboxypeptidase [Cytophagales bacterium]|nr:LD-carboxypeptidase [Cytophagales bacterium]
MSVQPTYLSKGDQIAIISPAGIPDKINVLDSADLIAQWGLIPVLGSNVFNQSGYFAGTDDERLREIQKALDNPDIKAILFTRGGYGLSRIIDQIDWTNFMKNPKWLCGFSDITMLHTHVNKMGYASLHCAMANSLARQPLSAESLRQAVFGEKIKYPEKIKEKLKTFGENFEIVGGNLCVICNSLGTPSEIETKGKVLFIEEIGEALYAIDRFMVQLKRAGKLTGIKGILTGHFTGCKDSQTPFGLTAQEIVESHVEHLGIPVVHGMPSGHEEENRAVVLG